MFFFVPFTLLCDSENFRIFLIIAVQTPGTINYIFPYLFSLIYNLFIYYLISQILTYFLIFLIIAMFISRIIQCTIRVPIDFHHTLWVLEMVLVVCYATVTLTNCDNVLCSGHRPDSKFVYFDKRTVVSTAGIIYKQLLQI